LDIYKPNSSDILTDIVSKNILNKVGQSMGKADELINAYIKKYEKSYKWKYLINL